MIDKTYPNIAEWVKSYGWIEIGQDEHNTSFVRAIDIGGLVWKGKNAYASIDEAFKEMIATFKKRLPYAPLQFHSHKHFLQLTSRTTVIR
jgi:hypothetical protein